METFASETMKIKKSHLETLYLVLKDTSLKLSEARKRDVFFNDLTTHLNQFYADRKKIYETFCNKKEDGTPDVTDNQFHFDKSVQKELSEELEQLFNEEIEIKGYDTLKTVIENSDHALKAGEAEVIDAIFKE